MRVLGVDLGRIRIGLAVGESEFKVASPRTAIAASGTLAKDAIAIDEVAKREEVDRIVVGQPINEEDERMARVCGMLADSIRALGWHVDLVDESFSSVQAETHLVQSDLRASDRRKRRDGEAAAIILERYFDVEART